jgi:hypothetical protein
MMLELGYSVVLNVLNDVKKNNLLIDVLLIPNAYLHPRRSGFLSGGILKPIRDAVSPMPI